jgi:hypothetical protein
VERKKLSAIIILIGVICLVLSPILGWALEKQVLVDNSQNIVTIDEASYGNIRYAYAFPFTITRGHKVTVEFSVSYPDTDAYLKIIGKIYYETAYAGNASSSGLTGLSFIYSQFAIGQDPASLTNNAISRTINDQGFWYIEFAGGVSGDYLVFYPGDYYVIVYGQNGAPSDANVRFNILIKIDSIGDVLAQIFLYIGFIAVVIGILFLIYGYVTKLRRADL